MEHMPCVDVLGQGTILGFHVEILQTGMNICTVLSAAKLHKDRCGLHVGFKTNICDIFDV